jgi:hypothetical protein
MTRFITRCQRWVLLCVFLLAQGALWAVDTGALAAHGKGLYDKGEYSKALQTFLKLKKADPSNPIAREYISKCTEKIMEVERAARIKNAVESGKSSSSTFSPKEQAPAWTAPKTKPKSQYKDPKGAFGSRRRVLRAPPVVVPGSEKEIKTSTFLIKREVLVQGYKNKILDGNSIDLVRTGGQVEVVAFMNRLFLPFSDCLAPDAVPAIESIAAQMRAAPAKTTLLRAVDSLTPAVRHQMLDLPMRRVSILFTYLMHGSTEKERNDGRGTFTAADLDD